jgi:ectoine hydroxylase-related dioxygenase (phytanoyl-CoA dioxygenase family)
MPTSSELSLGEHYQTQSYILVRRLIEPSEAETLRTICEDILRQWFAGVDPTREKPTASAEATVMRHLNHPAYFAERPEWFPILMDLIADERVLSALREVLDDEPLFRCTSLFFNPRENSRDGNWHRDSQFLTRSDEEEKEFLFNSQRAAGLQLQMALVPSEDAEVVPGSHLRWDTPEEYHIRKDDGGAHSRSSDMPGALRVRLEPGDAVAFNPCALHRGRYHTDKLRRTIMLTYTTQSGDHPPDYFNHQPWFLDPDHLKPLKPQTRAFFEPFVETFRTNWLKA